MKFLATTWRARRANSAHWDVRRKVSMPTSQNDIRAASFWESSGLLYNIFDAIGEQKKFTKQWLHGNLCRVLQMTRSSQTRYMTTQDLANIMGNKNRVHFSSSSSCHSLDLHIYNTQQYMRDRHLIWGKGCPQEIIQIQQCTVIHHIILRINMDRHNWFRLEHQQMLSHLTPGAFFHQTWWVLMRLARENERYWHQVRPCRANRFLPPKRGAIKVRNIFMASIYTYKCIRFRPPVFPLSYLGDVYIRLSAYSPVEYISDFALVLL